MNPLVHIVILNWNGKDLTIDCLKSLANVIYDNYKILIVDNGSNDNSVNMIKNQYPNVEILQLEKNVGYAAGNNAGFDHIKNSNPDYVIFLNNDTTVDPNFIEPLIKPLIENSDIYQSVPKIFYADYSKTIWYAGGKVNLWLGLVSHKGIRKDDNNSFNQLEYTDYATGCCFCMRYDDYDKLGGFDTSFPMYSEDVDLSLRIRDKGKNILYAPNSIIWHKVSASIAGELSIIKLKRKLRGLIKLFYKHTSIIQKITIALMWIISIPFQLIKLIYLIITK
jgi:GT2 family glycosyltransferase